MKTNNENMIKAEQTTNLLVSDLKAAYETADPVVEIVLLPILEKATQLENSLKILNRAIKHRDSKKRSQ